MLHNLLSLLQQVGTNGFISMLHRILCSYKYNKTLYNNLTFLLLLYPDQCTLQRKIHSVLSYVTKKKQRLIVQELSYALPLSFHITSLCSYRCCSSSLSRGFFFITGQVPSIMQAKHRIIRDIITHILRFIALLSSCVPVHVQSSETLPSRTCLCLDGIGILPSL